MLINECHSPLFCIVKISLFGVLTTIIFNAQTSQCSTLKEPAFLVLDACSYKNLSNRKVP